MAVKPLPSQGVLRQLLDYDPETGVLRWKARGPEWFQTNRSCSVWNARYAGREALNRKSDKGYLCGAIDWQRAAAHRVIWKMVTGLDPTNIDHIDGDKTNNRVSNLRDVSKSGNARNRKRPSNNSSGIIGVSQRSDTGAWVAYIRRSEGGKQIKLGQFANLSEAAEARKNAEILHQYHENHGR